MITNWEFKVTDSTSLSNVFSTVHTWFLHNWIKTNLLVFTEKYPVSGIQNILYDYLRKKIDGDTSTLLQLLPVPLKQHLLLQLVLQCFLS